MRKYGWFFSIKSGRKLELWLYAMTFSRTDDETQIRLSSWIKYEGKNLKLLFFFLRDKLTVKQKKNPLPYFHAQKLCCQDLIAGTKPHDCSQMSALFEQKRPIDMTVLEKICCQRSWREK